MDEQMMGQAAGTAFGAAAAGAAGAMAGGILGGAIGEFAAKHGSVLTDANAAEYQKLPDVITQMQEALNRAIEIDEQRSTTFLQELGQVWERGWGYFEDRDRFIKECAAVKARAESHMEELRLRAKPAIDRLGVPDELAAEQARWRSVAGVTMPAMNAIPGLRQIKDWAGKSESEYSTMAGVQINAAQEYQPMAPHMIHSITQASFLNKMVLTAVYGYVKMGVVEARKQQSAGAMEFWVNTAHVDAVLDACLRKLPEQLTMAEGPSNKLGSEIRRIQQTPAVIADGWPSGQGKAGVAAQIPTGVPTSQHLPTTTSGGLQVDSSGVGR